MGRYRFPRQAFPQESLGRFPKRYTTNNESFSTLMRSALNCVLVPQKRIEVRHYRLEVLRPKRPSSSWMHKSVSVAVPISANGTKPRCADLPIDDFTLLGDTVTRIRLDIPTLYCTNMPDPIPLRSISESPTCVSSSVPLHLAPTIAKPQIYEAELGFIYLSRCPVIQAGKSTGIWLRGRT